MRLIQLLFTFIMTSWLVIPKLNAQISSAGLVAQWDYNGNTGDSSGNARHGTGFNLAGPTGPIQQVFLMAPAAM